MRPFQSSVGVAGSLKPEVWDSGEGPSGMAAGGHAFPALTQDCSKGQR